MKHTFASLIILGIMFVSGLWNANNVHHTRAPASLIVGCAQLFISISSVASPWHGFVRRMPRPRLSRLDVQEVEGATQLYSARLRAGEALEDIVPETMEETLGLIEAVLVTRGFSPVDYARMDALKRGRLAFLLKQVDNPGKFSLESYENIWAEIFMTRIGRFERFKTIFSNEASKRQALALMMQEEVARLGLIKAGKKYALLENPEASVRRFKNSKFGRVLATSIFNIPIAFGMPPLVLPRFSRVRLPPELAQDLLDQGLSDDNLRRVDTFLKQYSAGRFGIDLSMQDRYELIRRSYTTGLGIYFLVLAVWESVVRAQEIEEQEDVITDSIADMQQLLDKAEKLEQMGYDIFETNQNSSSTGNNSLQECRDLKDCLDNLFGSGPWDKSSDGYKQCRDFVDPDGRCESF